MSQVSNIARLPQRDKPTIPVCSFAGDYIESMFYGANGWQRAVGCLESYFHRLSPSMQSFVAQMGRRKTRPTINQLSLLVSLIVNVKAQELFERFESEDRDGADASKARRERVNRTAHVIPLKANL